MDSQRIVLITGANTGIGYETVKALLLSANLYHILLGCRSLEKGNAAITQLRNDFPSSLSTLELLQVDITSDESIHKAFEQVKAKHDHVDVLINNAGAAFDLQYPKSLDSMREVFNKSWDVNVAGTQIMTHTFIPLLLKSSEKRLLFITSGLSTLDGISKTFLPVRTVPPPGWPKPPMPTVIAYQTSKTALNMLMLTWSWMLKADGVKVWCIGLGHLATGLANGDPELMKRMGAGDPAMGGEFVKRVVEGERDSDVGKVVISEGIQPW